MMESRDMRQGLRPAEGVCVLVGAETKKIHRNSEKGTDIGVRFVLFACLTSESHGLTRSRGRPLARVRKDGRDSVQAERGYQFAMGDRRSPQGV